MELTGKVAVVSGGGSGIGRATVLALIERGASVVVADIDIAGAEETVRMAASRGGEAAARRCDVTRSEDLAAAFTAATAEFGRFDIAFNNAGIGGEDLFSDVAGDWQRIVNIDLTAVIDATRIAVREMRRGGKPGVIINTASMGGLLPMPDSPVYAAAKAGVVNFSRSLGYLAADSNIRVNAICPSFVDTPLVRRSGEERMQEVGRLVGGILEPEDIAAGVIELIEDDSRFGSVMRVTIRGGRDFVREVRPF